MTERLQQQERVRRRADFEHIYAHGAKRHGRFMTMFVLARESVPTDTGRSRFGVAATRKLGGAVVRNRAKRLSRELFRRHKPDAGFDVVVVPRREFLAADFPSLERDYVVLLSGRLGYELVQKSIMLGVPIVAAVSAPSSLAIELAERFNVALAGFVRDARCNLYAHSWRVR